MERRVALRNMGMAMGLTVATPTLLSILQSCQRETAVAWTPKYFTPGQGAVLIKLVDIIIPKTDTPSASEVQVHAFVDSYVNEVSDLPEQELMSMAFTAFINKALADSGKDDATDLSAEDLEPVLAEALAKRDAAEEARIYEQISSYQQAQAAGEPKTLDEAIARYMFANNLRGAVIWAYKTSEYVGEEVLAYLPVPGGYTPCGDLNELTGGKAWSLS